MNTFINFLHHCWSVFFSFDFGLGLVCVLIAGFLYFWEPPPGRGPRQIDWRELRRKAEPPLSLPAELVLLFWAAYLFFSAGSKFFDSSDKTATRQDLKTNQLSHHQTVTAKQ